MVFLHPGLLWLLLLVVPLVAMHFGRRMSLRPFRTVVVTTLRAVTFVLLVLAIARPVVEWDDPSRTVVVVADLSGSIGDDDVARMQASIDALVADKRSEERIERVVFDHQARHLVSDPVNGEPERLAALRPGGEFEPGSVLAEAIELAGAIVPGDGRGRVVLYTDGRETGGDALAVATRLAERGIGITVEPVGMTWADEVILRAVAVPSSCGIGATVELRAEVESAKPTQANLIVRCEDDGQETVSPVLLQPGVQTVTCRQPLRREGIAHYTVRVESETDTLTDNNTLSWAIHVEPPQDVWVVEDAAGTPATTTLASLLGNAAKVARVDPADLSAPDALEGVNLLVIADTPAEAIGNDTQKRINSAVIEGMGLLVTGGRRAFGPGGYGDTPLAELMPVRFVQNVERRDPSATLVIIIDTSGSMGGPRVNLAKEIARLSFARLKPHDKVGIVEFYGSKRWAAPIQPASNAIDLQRALNRLSAGGGTVILPAIEEAFYALQNVCTRTKHVLVLTDGGVEPGAFEPLIRKMADRGTTLSTVMVGPGGHSAFLASLAQWGRGRFYAAPDRFNLPEIIVKQPESAMLPPFVERPTSLIRKQDDPVIEGIDLSTAPELRGYVETEPRPTADIVLESNLNHPILARWRYGLGSVAALTTQLGGEWSSELVKWPPYAKLVSNLVRSLRPPTPTEALRLNPVLRPGAVEVRIDNHFPERDESFAVVELILTDSEGGARTWELDPVRPDRWNLRVTDLSPGTYSLEAHTQDGRLSGNAALTVPPIREVSSLGPNYALLDRIRALRDQAARLPEVGARRPREIWPALVGASLVLLLLNVLVRRWPDSPDQAVSGRVPVGCILFFCITAPLALAQEQPSAEEPRAVRALPREIVAAVEHVLSVESPVEADRCFADLCRRVLGEDGRLDRLVDHLRQRSREDARGLWFLGCAAWENGDLELARQALVQSAARSQAGSEVWGELARIEELLGDDPGALAALERAIARERDPNRRFALRIRQALILYDGSEPAEGARALQRAVHEHPNGQDVAKFCAYLAALNGDSALAVAQLRPSGGGKRQFHEHLFRGLFFLRMDRPEQAVEEFQQAYRYGPLSRDRRFALERIVASARLSGRLEALADTWLADPQLAADKLFTLVTVLRELGRSDEALAWLKRPDRTAEQQRLFESTEFQREMIAIAVEAGLETEAQTTYQALLEREPARIEWRVGLARLMLLDGRREQAVQLFENGVERLEDPGRLLDLAGAARDLSLDEPALAAARKAGGQRESAHVAAVLFEADLARLRGNPDHAVELLKQLIAVTQADSKALLPLAEAFERYGDKAEALRLFKRLYDETGAEDVLLRLAWLLEENQHFDEAYVLWKNLWQTTQTPARLRQAQERMLDLASRTGKLADLAIALEEKLDDGTGGERELALLVDIYTIANDPVSATEILQDFTRRSGNQLGMLQRLARVYLSCEQFGRCNAVLRRLVTLDPPNATDYLQQIAIVALERRQPQEAKAVLERLSALAGESEEVDEFSAGVLDMIGLHGEAAQSYGRVLAKHPDRIEAFLLWGNAMRAAGNADRAIARLQNLVEEAQEDDLFTVAVDGLLNLEAKPAVLRSALRRVYARIAAKPDKVYLYNLAEDLLEAMGQTAKMNEVLEQAIVVAGERRSQLLRELMDGAYVDGRNDRVISFGRSLLALGEQVPPQVYLDLGEAMIKTGLFNWAERVFERAGIAGDFSTIQQRVATCYDQAGLPAAAERVIRQLLVTQPDNVSLLIRSGGLCEQLGYFERAFEQYYRASDLMLRRLPAVVRLDELTGSRHPGVATGRRRRRAVNLDEIAQYFESAANGLLNAARTEELRARLLRELPARVEEELGSLVSGRLRASVAERNPRLDRLSSFVRHVCFALHAPEVADRLDRKLIETYSRDDRLFNSLIQTRIDWGLYSRAAALGDLAKSNNTPAALALDAYLSDARKLDDALAKNGLDESMGRRLVPLLIMAGRDDEARRAIRATRAGSSPNVGDTAVVMLAGAIALDDHEAPQLWMGRWLDACRKLRKDRAVADNLERCVRMVWNHLSPSDRNGLVGRIDRMADVREQADRVRIDLLRLRLVEGPDVDFEWFEEFAEEAVRTEALGVSDLVLVLRAAPVERRPAMVRAMLAARKPGGARKFLMELAGAMPGPADERMIATFENLFKASPPAKLRNDRAYGDVTAGGWNRNSDQPELGRRIGEILLSEMPNKPSVLTAVAIARSNAGAHDEAMLLAGEAVDVLLAPKKPCFQKARMWSDLASLMQPEDLRELLTELEDRREIEGATPSLLYGQGVLLEASGRASEAIAPYRAAFQAAPTSRIFSRKVIRLLRRSGREAELARVLSAHLTKSSIMESHEWRVLSAAYCNLYDAVAAFAAVERLEGPLRASQMMYVARMMGRTDDVRTIFRRFIIGNRNQGRFFNPFWPTDPSIGGMTAYLQAECHSKRTNLFVAVADLPFAEAEFDALLTAAPPNRRDVPGLIKGLIRATSVNGTGGRLIDALLDAHDRDALTTKDYLLILALGKDDPQAVPEPLLRSLDGFAVHLDATCANGAKRLATIAKLMRARGDREQARRILKWLVAYDVQYGHRGSWLKERFERMDEYTSLLDDAVQKRDRLRLLAYLAPTPFDSLSDEFDSALLERGSAAGDTAEVERRLESLRGLLEADRSGDLFPALYAEMARCYAAAGKFEPFAEMVGKALITPKRGQGANIPPDCRKMLPPADAMDEPERYVDHIVSAVEARQANGGLCRELATQSLCLAGQWCVENDLITKARSMMPRIEQLAGDLGGHWLWLADLARQAGVEATAVEIETRLLKAEMLPVPRVPHLLDTVESEQGQEAADQLAVRVAAYSDHPEVLKRALRLAQATDQTAAEDYLRRLRIVAPDETAKPE